MAGLNAAFSIAVANAFWLGVIAGVVAFVVVVVGLPEVALRGMGKATEGPDGEVFVPMMAE